MRQEGILLTKNNIPMIVNALDDYKSVDSFVEDYGYMLETHDTLVLVRDILDDSYRLVSYVVTMSMFNANAKGTLNETEFNLVTQR